METTSLPETPSTTSTKPKVKFAKTRAHQTYRLKDGTKVPGASTVAKIGDDPSALIHWAWTCGMNGQDYKKVREQAADIGTLAHFMVECHLRGQEPDTSEFSKADIDRAETAFMKFLEFWQTNGLTVSGEPEVQLVSEKYKYGGTLDLPATDRDGGLVLLDWKTSGAIYDTHLSQLAGYEGLWNENHPDRPITRRAIVRIGKEDVGDFEYRWLADLSKHLEAFRAKAALYHALKECRKTMKEAE